MGECIYLCHQCHNVFRLPVPDGSSPAEEVKCPECGSPQTSEMSSWTPIGYNLSEGSPMWECVCQQCQNAFKIPAPSSPAQAQEIICPTCGGRHIHRLTPAGAGPIYCG